MKKVLVMMLCAFIVIIGSSCGGEQTPSSPVIQPSRHSSAVMTISSTTVHTSSAITSSTTTTTTTTASLKNQHIVVQTTSSSRINLPTKTTKSSYTTITTQAAAPVSGKLICTIIDDDAMSLGNLYKLKYACDQADIKAAIATLTERWDETEPLVYRGATSLKNMLHQLQNEGHDIILHAYHQGGSNIYGEDCWWDVNNLVKSLNQDKQEEISRRCRADLEKGLQMMRKEGFSTDFWVTPENSDHPIVLELARDFGFKARFTGGNTFNGNSAKHSFVSASGATITRDTSRFYVYRQRLNSLPSYTGDIETLKVDFYSQIQSTAETCANEQGWLVLMTHFRTWPNGSNSYKISDNALACFLDTVQKLKSMGYEFMTVSEAWEYQESIYRFYEAS